MTASGEQPKVRSERRIIERPRLIKLLDETDARVILVLGPAGFGKTTLARQWAGTLSGAIWVGLTQAHRDVARFAEAVSNGIDRLDGDARDFMTEYLRAAGNPQRAASEVASLLADQLEKARVQWLIFDDVHEIEGAEGPTEMLEILQERLTVRWLVTARTRPRWATRRRTLYGEIFEIPRESLAMDEDESKLMLGRRPELLSLAQRAEGWPAVIGLAARMSPKDLPKEVMPSALYDYLAGEIFQSAPAAIQEHLLDLALAPELGRDGSESGETGSVDEMRDLGFLSSENETELHPLIREFLLEKLRASPGAESAALAAVQACITHERWDRAFELVLRFDLASMVEPVLEAAYGPLIRSGHVATLAAFTASVRVAPSFPPPVVDLVDADLAMRDGAFGLAADLATRVREALSDEHSLSSRANTIIAQSAFVRADLAMAAEHYRLAYEGARDERDQADALYGWAVASIQGEIGDPRSALNELQQRRGVSPLDLVKHATANLARMRFNEGYSRGLDIDEALHSLPLVTDPRTRTSFMYCAVYALALRGEYTKALELAVRSDEEVDSFNLEFAKPYTQWNLALVNLGLRRFGAAERNLQRVEDASTNNPLGFHVLNASILRMRLALQTGELPRVHLLMRSPDEEMAIPSLHAEYQATQALCLAVTGSSEEALVAAKGAGEMTTAVEVEVLEQVVRATVGASRGEMDDAMLMFALAERRGVWDPVIAALRTFAPLREGLACVEAMRPRLETLYRSSNDLALARKAGFRTRATEAPGQLLTPRELEVLELLSRGFRNRDIARALVISDSTTKVHVRHILEKLGVRTRTEAVARLELFR